MDSDLMIAPADWPPALARAGATRLPQVPRPDCASADRIRRGDRVPARQPKPRSAPHAARPGGKPRRDHGFADGERRAPGDRRRGAADPGSGCAAPQRRSARGAPRREGKSVEDLRRAIAQADERLWWQALELAREFDGVPAFASGLRLLPEGVELARRLGIDGVRSTRHELRRQGIQTAEGIDALLSSGLGARRQLVIVAREFFPPARFMRALDAACPPRPLGPHRRLCVASDLAAAPRAARDRRPMARARAGSVDEGRAGRSALLESSCRRCAI